mmetsp:Transcript_47047/g.92598  ORF Transcript_47047/g.92598 Transcript_47047/m.92598 type:complete len:482 (+) Transcript_47047:112-1557(+)
MIITNLAVYNVLPDKRSIKKCKRRIDIQTLVSITISSVSDEFVLHVPEEYDYRFKSAKKDAICKLLSSLVNEARAQNPQLKKLSCTHSSESDLTDRVWTKTIQKHQSREDIRRRIQILAAEDHESDHEDMEDGKEETKVLDTSQDADVRLDHFELLKVLGRGSFGKVMLVRKKSDQCIYAMKILKKRTIIAKNQVEHTKAERKILGALHHPFLVSMRYAFQTKEKLYLVLDYYNGGELFFHLKNQKRFPEAVARIYVGEIALALGHLHSLKFIYRDLKPENILLDDNGHVCLTDFGLSKDVDPEDKALTFCGTPEYLAPEIVTGAGHDKAVDWWSLGILLYELTVGIPPFYSQNVNDMYNKIQHGVLRFPPFLSNACKDIIVSLLNRDPRKRLGSTNDIDDIKSHAFFDEVDWDQMMKKAIDVPFKPTVEGGETCIANFDTTFTSEPVVDSVVADSMSVDLQNYKDAFNDFHYADKGGPPA